MGIINLFKKEEIENISKSTHYFLIDYENVHSNGFDGIEYIQPKDHIIMFYSKEASKIEWDLAQKLFALEQEKGVSVENISIKNLGKNALDFMLASVLGMIIGSTNEEEVTFFIISKDNDYNPILVNIPDVTGLYNSKTKFSFKKASKIRECFETKKPKIPKKRTTTKPKKNPVQKKNKNLNVPIKALRLKLISDHIDTQVANQYTNLAKNTVLKYKDNRWNNYLNLVSKNKYLKNIDSSLKPDIKKYKADLMNIFDHY